MFFTSFVLFFFCPFFACTCYALVFYSTHTHAMLCTDCCLCLHAFVFSLFFWVMLGEILVLGDGGWWMKGMSGSAAVCKVRAFSQ